MKGKLSILDQAPASSCTSDVPAASARDSRLARGTFRGRAAVVTLGCAKNQVDSEVMLGVLEQSGFEIVADVAEADVAIVNTCGFLESAVQESLDRILEAADYKETGRLRKLIVSGCMVERYKGDLIQELPEVDAFLGTDDLLSVGDIANGGMQGALDAAARPYFLYDDTMPRHLSTKSHFAYVKISEGCNRPCTFCVIPRIRGAMRSRDPESVIREVTSLGERGVREVNLIAQDLTSYGTDRKGPGLAPLLQQLNDASAVDWIRLLYAYPIGIDAPLLRAIADLPRVCEYLDLPLQHASETVLRRMQRPIGRYAARRIAEFIHQTAPEIMLRTTFIVGFPGETEEDVRELEAFVREGHFSSVGVFEYSPEQGSPAAGMPDQVPQEERAARRERVMLAQQEVVSARLEDYVGTELAVLIEGTHEDTDLLWSGRTRFQAPEVDGLVIVNDVEPGSEETLLPGVIGRVEITEVAGYDLVGRYLRSQDS